MGIPKPVTRMMQIVSRNASPEQKNDPSSSYLGADETIAEKTAKSTDEVGIDILRRVSNLNIASSGLFTLIGSVMSLSKIPVGNIEVGGGLPGELLEKVLEYGPGIAATAVFASTALEFVEIRKVAIDRLNELAL